MKTKRNDSNYRLRVMAEYGSSGIWRIQEVGVFRHSMVEHSALNMPDVLAKRFDAWINKYEQQLQNPHAFDPTSFNAEGRKLAVELAAHLNGEVPVEYVPESSNGSIEVPESIAS